jgi:hypothetical protein
MGEKLERDNFEIWLIWLIKRGGVMLFYQPCPQSANSSLGTIISTEFVEDVTHMGFDRADRNV